MRSAGKVLLAEGCSLLVAKENQKTTSDFAALSQKAVLQMPFPSMTPPVKMGYRKVRRLSCNPKFKIILPLIMARAQRRPFQIVSTSEKSGTPQAMTEGVLPSKKEPLHANLCNGSFTMLLQIHHAADLGGGGGHGA